MTTTLRPTIELRPRTSSPTVPVREISPRTGARRPWWVVLVLMALVVAAVVAVQVSGATPTYPVTAVFAKTPGLFPGAAVNELGVRVGTVTAVRNVANTVVVTMAVSRSQPIAADAIASFQSPALLGEPDIELSPGYSGGPTLLRGAVIPESRTTEPVSTDQVLKDLAATLNQLNPKAVGNLITNLAQDLDGEGAALHQLITGAAGTLRLLAEKGDDLGQLNGTLAQLTGTLDSRTSEIQSLVTDYDTVSGVLAAHSPQLSSAINELTAATTDLVNLLTPNLAPLEQDIGTLTTAGRTLDRNIPFIDEGLDQSVLLFTAAGRAYDPTYNWVNLNNQLPVGVTGDYVAGLIRDRLAGVCRRILANHSTGLSAQEIATLGSCGNPNSGFFDPILNGFSSALAGVGSGSLPSSQTPLSMLQQGLSQIPGVGSTATTSPTSGGSSGSGSGTSGSKGGSSGSGSSGSGSGSSGSGSGSSGSGSGSSGSGSGSSGSGSGSSGSGSGSGGCLLGLVCGVSTTATGGPDAQLVTYSPSLTAPAARLLPPMPGHALTAPGRHHKKHHHGNTPVLTLGRAGARGGIS